MYIYLLLIVSLSYSVPNIAHNAEITGKNKSVNNQKQQMFYHILNCRNIKLTSPIPEVCCVNMAQQPAPVETSHLMPNQCHQPSACREFQCSVGTQRLRKLFLIEKQVWLAGAGRWVAHVSPSPRSSVQVWGGWRWGGGGGGFDVFYEASYTGV